MIDGAQITGSIQQKDVDVALRGLLGTADATSDDAAFPVATEDMAALTTELDKYIAPGGL